MPKCRCTNGLEVYPILRSGGNDVSNARVLCGPCHEHVSGSRLGEAGLPQFSVETKKLALLRAYHQCECVSDTGCH